MANIFKQLLSVGPAEGVCLRLQYAFSKHIAIPGAEPYSALIASWEEAIQPYEKLEPVLYQMHQTYRLCDQICKVFAMHPDQKYAARGSAMMLASLCYSPYLQSPSPKNTWIGLLDVFREIEKRMDVYNQRFAELNPRSHAVFMAEGRQPFDIMEIKIISEFLENWPKANNVKWRN